MKPFFILQVYLILQCYNVGFSQSVIELAGGLLLDSTDVVSPEAGTIRWTGTDLEGYNGIIWISLTGDALGTVMDVSGNSYMTLKIGQDTWMIENLRTQQFSDGVLIDDITSSPEWRGATSPAVCRYENTNINLLAYGYLYNHHAVEDDRLCPISWHVSTASEWDTLLDLLGGSLIAGASLKEENNIHWQRPNAGATNESGFTALPGGSRQPQGDFIDVTMYGNYWALDVTGLATKGYRLEYTSIDVPQLNISSKNSGFSVRCVKNKN